MTTDSSLICATKPNLSMKSIAMAAEGEEKTAAGQTVFSRRIEFHIARRPYTGVPPSSGEFQLEILNPDNSEGLRSASEGCAWASATEAVVNGKRSAGGEVCEHGLDPELSLRITFQRIGAGLENLGNTCYLNSVLQCLTYTEPFAAYLQSGKHKSTCRAAGFCAMCALQNHVRDALQSTGKILRPFHLVRNLRCISRSFRNSRQEDAHEYMVNLLESMHKCCLPSGVPSESPSAYEKSLVHKIFGGQLRSQVKCMQCSNCFNKFDPFLDLSLEIARADSLRKAFAHFTATEQLDGGERQYQCQHCKKKVQAYKQLTIHKAPCVLTIHLKRFGSSIHGEKLNKKVDFESSLDLKPFVSGLQEGELKYTLYGVLVHAGWSTHSGHYFCYVRTSTGMWYSLDDNHVSQVSEKTVLSREAYMLFYVKDRTSTIKRSTTDVNLKSDISANSTLNKITCVERKLSSAIYSSAKAIHDAIIHNPPIFKNQKPLDNSTTKGNDGILSNRLLKTKADLFSFDTKKEDADMSPPGTSAQQNMTYDFKRSMKPANAVNSVGDLKEYNGANLLEHQEILVIPEIENTPGDCRKGAVSKMSKMLLAAQGPLFGRRHLLFMSLRLRRNKKKVQKRLQNSQNKTNRISADLRSDSEGTSTSKSFQADLNSGCSSGNDSKREFLKGEKNQLEIKNAEDNDAVQSCSASFLKARLREPTVAKWDAEDLVIPQIHELDDPPKRNIGYILDEWDEEYDKGKRKKLRSRQWFDGPNPFQKTADSKYNAAQQRMIKAAPHTSFGKEPLRIL